MSRPQDGDATPGGPAFWIAAVIGLGIAGFGLAGLLRNVHGEALTSWAKLFAGGLIAHDGLVVPVVALIGVLLVKLLPAWSRPPLQAGLVVSALVLVVAFPLVGPDARLANNPSLLPADYDRDLLIVLGAVWLAAAALLVGARRGERRSR